MGSEIDWGFILFLYAIGLILTSALAARLCYEAEMDVPQAVAVTVLWPLALFLLILKGAWRFVRAQFALPHRSQR